MPVIVDSALYRKGQRIEVDCFPHEFDKLRGEATDDGDFVWVGLYKPSEGELDDVAKAFGLHPLAVEDALKAHQRPKLERYDDSLFLTLKTLWYVDAEDAVETGEINLFAGHDFVITVRHGRGQELHSARARLESDSAILTHGPSAVIYAVCDSVVDGYTDVVRELEVDVDEIEASVFSPARTNDSTRIYVLKREIAEVRRAVLPLREPMRKFSEGLVHGVEREAGPFFRDVLDHLNQDAEVDRRPRLAALDGLRRPPGADHGPAERRHAQDLGRRRAGRRADPDRRRLRHELRAHARAGLAARLPVRPGADADGVGGALGAVQEVRLAVGPVSRSACN